MLHIEGLRCAFNLQGKVEVLKAGFYKCSYDKPADNELADKKVRPAILAGISC